jgi:hypothetical protein
MLQPQRDYMLQHRRTFNTTTSPSSIVARFDWNSACSAPLRLPAECAGYPRSRRGACRPGWVDKSIVCLAGLL